MRSQVQVLLLISLFFIKSAQSQSNELLIQGQTGKLYLEHTVVAKENWYSVGRLYNVSPKEIAPFNKLTMAQPLTIGEHLLIPLTTVNFSQNGLKSAGETLVPVYHIIQEKEWMYRISVNHNKVPIPSLEKWNNINKDQVKAGMHLIVGYLKVKTALSALATGGTAPAVATEQSGVPAAGSRTAAAATTTPTPATRPSNPPAGKPPVITATVAPPQPVVKTTAPPKESTTFNDAATKDTPAKETATKVTTVKETTPAAPAVHFNGGYFKPDFTDGGKTASGPAGIFKSTSGWQDGKYYALMNNVAVGTIVKITVPATGKSIYAKILGQLPDMKESAGLTVRISNAAAGELGEGEGRFNAEVKY